MSPNTLPWPQPVVTTRRAVRSVPTFNREAPEDRFAGDGTNLLSVCLLVRLRDATATTRDRLMQKLLDAGIATRRGIMSIHREPCYANQYGVQRFPESERASDQCLCLPLYPQMTAEEQDYVLDHLHRVTA